MSNVYRERVLSVLRKPYNNAEYKRHRKAVKDGSYLEYYPGKVVHIYWEECMFDVYA